jgi:hypothetical protein
VQIKKALPVILFFLLPKAWAQHGQDTLQVLFNKLSYMQSGVEGFSPGIFPSYRYHDKVPYYKADENIFFSAIIGIRLKRLRDALPEASKTSADSLLNSIILATAKFSNKYGRVSYNFWPTRPISQFPGDPFLSRMKGLHIPDDADDSFLILGLKNASPEEWTELRKMAQDNAPGIKRKLRNTPKQLTGLNTHGTWLGDKMPPEVDFCVLSNILYSLSEAGLPMNSQDSVSIEWLRMAFETELLMKKPYRISPQYLHTSTCLYHLAFLISSKDFRALDNLKQKLIDRLMKKLEKPVYENEYKLIRNGLAYLGVKAPKPIFRNGYFPFFYANPGSVLPNPLNGPAAHSKVLVMGYECPAWDLFLDLEFLILNQAR